MRAGNVASLAVGLVLAAGASLSAHRYDEYLHAARIAIDPTGIRLELSLTPGMAVADAVIRDIDTNGDTVMSAPERAAYLERVARGLSMRLDDRAVPLTITDAMFPDPAALRGGDVAIVLRIDARAAHVAPGAHRLSFQNGNGTHGAVYLANALLPEDRRVSITGMQHAMDQSALTVAFTVR